LREYVGDSLTLLASYLSDPHSSLHRLYVDISMPYRPGQYGQATTITKELARRTLLVLQGLITTPVAAICAPVSFIRVVGNWMKKYDFSVRIKHRIPTQQLQPNERLRVLFLNTCFLFCGFAADHGGARPWKERIVNIVELVRRNNPHIVCFGEVHDIKGGVKLCQLLERLGYKIFIHDIGKNNLGANSGLFMASKLDVTDVSYTPFDSSTLLGNIKYVRKGILHFTVNNCANIAVTHFQHSENDFDPKSEEKAARQRQVGKVMDVFRDKANPRLPMLLLGDFNMTQKEFLEESALSKCCQDAYLGEEGTQTDYYDDLLWNPEKAAREGPRYKLLDRCLLVRRLGESEPIIPALGTVVADHVETQDLQHPDKILSDHRGILAELTTKI